MVVSTENAHTEFQRRRKRATPNSTALVSDTKQMNLYLHSFMKISIGLCTGVRDSTSNYISNGNLTPSICFTFNPLSNAERHRSEPWFV